MGFLFGYKQCATHFSDHLEDPFLQLSKIKPYDDETLVLWGRNMVKGEGYHPNSDEW